MATPESAPPPPRAPRQPYMTFKSRLLILGSLSLVALCVSQGRQLIRIMSATTMTTTTTTTKTTTRTPQIDDDHEKALSNKRKQRILEHLANLPQESHTPQDKDEATTTTSTTKLSATEAAPRQGESQEENSATTAKPPLNILLLYGDDWRFDTLGMENPIVQTPNLDKLARRGVRFTHNCVTTSVCWTSRATLATGQYMSRHGLQKLSQRYTGPWNETWYSLLHQRANYHTAYVGKWGVLGFPPRGQVDSPCFNAEEVGWHLKTIHRSDPYPPAPPVEREYHITEVNEFDAMNYLLNVQPTLPRDKPFVLTVAFFAPHAVDGEDDQYFPQNASFALYRDTPIPTPPTMTDESFARLPSKLFNEANEGRIRYRWRYDTPLKHERMMKNYYRLVSEVDATCGKLLDILEQRGLRDSTLVLFTTDNGYYQGEHGLADKWFPHQESLRVPLIIDDPRLPPDMRGTTMSDFTLNVDLAPTLLAAAGLETPPWMQGRDMADLYLHRIAPKKRGDQEEEPEQQQQERRRQLQQKDETRSKWSIPSSSRNDNEWRIDFFYEHAHTRHNIPSSEALVRKEWKYVYWPTINVEQLFDLQEDPMEEMDLLPQHITYHKGQSDKVQHWNFTWREGQTPPLWDLWQIRKRFLQLKQEAK